MQVQITTMPSGDVKAETITAVTFADTASESVNNLRQMYGIESMAVGSRGRTSLCAIYNLRTADGKTVVHHNLRHALRGDA